MSVLKYDEAIPHIVYDCSLPIQERIQKALRFPTATKAARFIGLRQDKLPYYTSHDAIVKQRRYKSEKHGREFAIRIIHK